MEEDNGESKVLYPIIVLLLYSILAYLLFEIGMILIKWI